MRIPGLGGEVLQRAGGVPVALPGSEKYFTALQTGVIDATEWVGPYNDLALVTAHVWRSTTTIQDGMSRAQRLEVYQ